MGDRKVRIRGKRYAPGERPVMLNAAKRKAHKSFLHERYSRRKHAAFSGALGTTADEAESTLSSRKSEVRNPDATLEGLPTELLQQVFEWCPNIHLPAASLVLCRKLSTDALKRDLLDKIARRDWRKDFPNDMARAYGMNDQGRVLSHLLRMRWVTWQLVSPFLPLKPPESDWWYTLDCAHYPVKVLHGPWTDNKIEFFHALWSSGCQIDSVHSTDMEIASSGLMEAITSKNESAVEALTAWVRQKDPKVGLHTTGPTIRPQGPRVMPIIPIDLGHLRAAFKLDSLNKKIVRLLLGSVVSSELDLDDPELWATIQDHTQDRPYAAAWLKKRLIQVKRRKSDQRNYDMYKTHKDISAVHLFANE